MNSRFPRIHREFTKDGQWLVRSVQVDQSQPSSPRLSNEDPRFWFALVLVGIYPLALAVRVDRVDLAGVAGMWCYCAPLPSFVPTLHFKICCFFQKLLNSSIDIPPNKSGCLFSNSFSISGLEMVNFLGLKHPSSGLVFASKTPINTRKAFSLICWIDWVFSRGVVNLGFLLIRYER